MRHKILFLVGLLTAVTATGVFASSEGFGSQGAKGESALTREQMLTYAIQDEYLARSEYEAIMRQYGNARPFSNIIRAEERHIASLLELFAAYDIEPPVDDSASRVVVPGNLKSAYETGAKAEVENIAMYQRFLAESSDLPADVRALFEQHVEASAKHLNAFKNNLSRLD